MSMFLGTPLAHDTSDDEHFATAGVTKKIKVFNFANVVQDPVDVHFPMREMQCRSKIR